MLDLSDTIHNGIIKAQTDYIKWTNLGLGHSAEYLIVANIAQKMADLKEKEKLTHIYVEQSIQELAEWDELPKDIEYRTGRCDICLEDEEEYAIIEVKNTLTNIGNKLKSIIQDLERIKIFLENNKYVQTSYVCFINANYIDDKENTDSNKKEIYNRIDERLNNLGLAIEDKFKNLNFTITEQKFIVNTDN